MKKITQYTRYGTILICVIQAWRIALFLQGLRSPGGPRIVPSPGLPFQLLTVLTLTTRRSRRDRRRVASITA